MTLLSILQFPDPRLRNHARPIEKVDTEISTLVDDMFETMYEYNGVGLASIQVNVPHRVIVIDVSENHNQPLCLINPEIVNRAGTQFDYEGCLSFPGVYDKVERAMTVRLRAQDQHGKTYEIDADGLLAICIQHEMDHLDGVLYIDHLSRLRQDRMRKKLEKIRRRTL